MKRFIASLLLLITLVGATGGCYMPPPEGLTPEEAERVRAELEAKRTYFGLGAAAVFATGVLILFGVSNSGEY